MNLKHHFLLAMPGLAGDYFADSLIYVCVNSPAFIDRFHPAGTDR